ncbi:hypothetical protein EBQ74_11700 [bacterium]|nr:hypothetical protein [bacterium]
MKEKLKPCGLIVFLGFIYGGYEFYDFISTQKPRLNGELQQAQTELETKKLELTRLTAFAEGISEVKSRLKKTNAEFEEVLEFIPRSLDLSKLLARLTVLARNSGVEIENFKPVKESSGAGNPTNETKTFYESVSIEMRLKGGFSQTVMFFDQISRLKRILNIESVKMVNPQIDDKRGPASPVTLVESQINLKTYRFSE